MLVMASQVADKSTAVYQRFQADNKYQKFCIIDPLREIHQWRLDFPKKTVMQKAAPCQDVMISNLAFTIE